MKAETRLVREDNFFHFSFHARQDWAQTRRFLAFFFGKKRLFNCITAFKEDLSKAVSFSARPMWTKWTSMSFTRRASQLLAVQPMTDGDWATAMGKIEEYRRKLAKKQYLHDPLYYFFIDHSDQHGPTAAMLGDYLPSMRLTMPQEMNSLLPIFSEEKETLFNQLLAAKRPSDVSAKTDEEYYIRDLVASISKAVTMPGKDDISEMEHTMRNVVTFLDATIGFDQECRVHYGEQTLGPTAVRRNEGSDPNECARAGYKVDVIVEYQELNWLPVIGCGEISGGIPRCSRAKEWVDTLKLSLELRNIWAMAQKELIVADAADLVIWGFTVVGRKLRIYALAAVRELFHLVLVEEVSLPSSHRDLVKLSTRISQCPASMRRCRERRGRWTF